MKLVVLVRRLRARPDGGPAAETLGCCDAAALETALALKRTVAGATVVAVAAGDAAREDAALAHALALGADRGLRVDDAAVKGLDYHGIARVLAAAVRHVGYDLVLAGDRSEDEVQGAVGPAVAEALGVPHLTGTLRVELEPGLARATRRDLGVVRTLRLKLPALLTIVTYDGERARPGAAARAVEGLDFATLGIQAMELKHRDRCLGRAHPVRVLRNATLVSEADELIARLREDHLL